MTLPIAQLRHHMKKHDLLVFALLFLLVSCTQDKPATTVQNTPTPKEGPFYEPEWVKNAVLYEVNTRQFSREGNFHGVTQQLPRIADMGVDVIWLMPIHPIGVKNRKGTLGSPYSVQDFSKINPDFGDRKSVV